MPLAAYGVLATFLGVATVAGSFVTWLVGPRRPRAAILPIAASVAVLGSVGHGARFGFGPTVTLFGYDVRLPFFAGLALLVALVVALGQRRVLESHGGAAEDAGG